MRALSRKSRSLRAALGIVGAGVIAGGVAAQDAAAAEFDRSDLEFILKQVDVAERNEAYGPYAGQAKQPLSQIVQHPTLPYGLRTVSGADNNIVDGASSPFGAADRLFPRLTTALFRSPIDDPTFDPDGPGPAGPVGSPAQYTASSGIVEDLEPRRVSNLIVDQTADNPAAQAAYDAIDNGRPGKAIQNGSLQIPNTSTDEGLSASYNSWFTFFGQFFDHGLDLVPKGGNGSVVIPLQPDDALYRDPAGPDGQINDDPATPADETADNPQNFMVLTRATHPGTHESVNLTTPFVDQNQTYTSHPSHQVFLREHVRRDGATVATGRFLDDANHGLATWKDVKTQAREKLGVILRDSDVLNVPVLKTDKYGRLITGPNGYAVFLTAGGGEVEAWNPDGSGVNQGLEVPATGLRTGHAFLDDIAHSASPHDRDLDHNPFTPKTPAVEDPDTPPAINAPGVQLPPDQYDGELLDRHFITGDGRGNENIALTTVHYIFHAEHNRLAEQVKSLAVESGDVAFLNKWLDAAHQVASVPTTQAGIDALQWNGERLFQAARFGTEMQYQHLVFEEFARKMQPEVDIFTGYHTEIDPAISAEFAHAVYRFGHSMLNETVPRTNADGSNPDATIADPDREMGLIEAFLNPVAFDDIGKFPSTTEPGLTDPRKAGGAVVRGATRQVANELDEFVTGALRNNLLGLPLDLATLNLARGRDTGIPTLQAARKQFFAATQHSQLAPYSSWQDFGTGLRHRESLVNFIAAYGTHPTLFVDPGSDGVIGDDPSTGGDESADDTPRTTMAQKRAAAEALIATLTSPSSVPALADGPDFMKSEGAWAKGGSAGTLDLDGETRTGLGNVDLWIGGLAERQMPFGGLLGSTFNYVFESQMERLQDGDRFYYLSRTAGLNFLSQLEENSFAELIGKHTDARNLPFDVFSRPDMLFDVANSAASGGAPIVDNPTTPSDESTLTRMADGTFRFIGGEHIVLAGSDDPARVDRLRADDGDDTIWGNKGGDVIEGGAGNDALNGNDGNDIIKDTFGIDNIKGGDGHDAISVGAGTGDLTLAGAGDDLVVQGVDEKEVFSGKGADLVQGSAGIDTVFGGEGDDWIEGGTHADLLQGGNGDPFQEDGAPALDGSGNADEERPIVHNGNDVIIGDGGNDDYDAEGGDDVMLTGPGIERNEGMMGFDWVTAQHDPQAANYDMFFTGLLPPDVDALRDRFDLVEGASGAGRDDVLRGDDRSADPPEAGAPLEGTMFGHALRNDNLAMYDGIAPLLDGVPGATQPDGSPSTALRFNGGNILLGGAGSDLLEGRGGNDVIDGDRWLSVRLKVTMPGGQELWFADTHSPEIGQPATAPTLAARMLSGEITPNQVDIVRSIDVATDPGSQDTAAFRFPRAEYTIGELRNASNDLIGYRVAHTGGTQADGVDILKNVEQAQFIVPAADPADPPTTITLDLATEAQNSPATGAVAFSSTAPVEGQTITVSQGTLSDPDVGPLAPGDGIQDASLQFSWEHSADGTTWLPAAAGPTFAPTQTHVGHDLRVVATYVDGDDVAQQFISASIGPVADAPDNGPATGPLTIAGAAVENTVLTADRSAVADPFGINEATVAFQWEQSAGGGPFTPIAGATAPTFTPGDGQVGQRLRVVMRFNDTAGVAETVVSDPTGVVANVNDAPTGAATIDPRDPRQGRLMTAAPGTLADADGFGALAYQWQRGPSGGPFTDIPGATGTQFTPTAAEAGLFLRVKVTYLDAQGTNETVFSAQSRRATRADANAAALAPALLGRTLLPATITSDVVQARGVPLTLQANVTTQVVQVRVFRVGNPRAALARAFVRVTPRTRRVTLSAPQIRRVLSQGGRFRIEITPGVNRSSLGKTTVKLMTVWKVRVR